MFIICLNICLSFLQIVYSVTLYAHCFPRFPQAYTTVTFTIRILYEHTVMVPQFPHRRRHNVFLSNRHVTPEWCHRSTAASPGGVLTHNSVRRCCALRLAKCSPNFPSELVRTALLWTDSSCSVAVCTDHV